MASERKSLENAVLAVLQNKKSCPPSQTQDSSNLKKITLYPPSQAKYYIMQKEWLIENHPQYIKNATYEDFNAYNDFIDNADQISGNPFQKEDLKTHLKNITTLRKKGFVLRKCEDAPEFYVLSFLLYKYNMENYSYQLMPVHQLFKIDDDGYFQCYYDRDESDDEVDDVDTGGEYTMVFLPQTIKNERGEVIPLRYKSIEELIIGEMDNYVVANSEFYHMNIARDLEKDEREKNPSIKPYQFVTFTELLKNDCSIQEHCLMINSQMISEELENKRNFISNFWKDLKGKDQIQKEVEDLRSILNLKDPRHPDERNILPNITTYNTHQYQENLKTNCKKAMELKLALENELINYRSILKPMKNLLDQMKKSSKNHSTMNSSKINLISENINNIISHLSFFENLIQEVNVFIKTLQSKIMILTETNKIMTSSKKSSKTQKRLYETLPLPVTFSNQAKGTNQSKIKMCPPEESTPKDIRELDDEHTLFLKKWYDACNRAIKGLTETSQNMVYKAKAI